MFIFDSSFFPRLDCLYKLGLLSEEKIAKYFTDTQSLNGADSDADLLLKTEAALLKRQAVRILQARFKPQPGDETAYFEAGECEVRSKAIIII